MPDLDQIKQVEQASVRPARGRPFKPPTIEHAVKAGGFLAGRPRTSSEQLKAVEKRNPARHPARRSRPLREGVIPTSGGTKIAAAAE
jgi:hypothetical protein